MAGMVRSVKGESYMYNVYTCRKLMLLGHGHTVLFPDINSLFRIMISR